MSHMKAFAQDYTFAEFSESLANTNFTESVVSYCLTAGCKPAVLQFCFSLTSFKALFLAAFISLGNKTKMKT